MTSETAQPNYRMRENFLKEFVDLLIKNSISDEERKRILAEEVERKNAIQNIRKELMSEEVSKQIPQNPVRNFNGIISKNRTLQKPQRINFAQKVPQQTKREGINLGKITQFLNDPAVLSVECPGPGKNLLLNRSGAIQASSMSLNKEEINSIVKEASVKARIPLTTGVFKAAFQNIIITAILSEYVGTRFLIQKKTPFQKH